MVIFHSLSNPMRVIHRNKKTFSVGLLENTHAGKKSWGLLFYSIKSKLLDYYILGSEDPTAISTLNELCNFTAENSTPRIIITDSNGVLGSENKWKHYLGRMFTPLRLPKPDKQDQNLVKHAIQNLKAGLSKIKNACEMGVLAYHC